LHHQSYTAFSIIIITIQVDHLRCPTNLH